MGEALVKGLLRESTLAPQDIIATNPRPERVEELVECYQIRATTDNVAAVREAGIVFFSVKPQV